MLARLQMEPHIDDVGVDRRGELLRVRVGSADDVRAVMDQLFELGFAAQLVADGETIEQRWYGPGDVGELSREEAYVIARRVVPAFTKEGSSGEADVAGLVNLVATALHECFVSNSLSAADPHGTLNSACARAVEAATRGRLGTDRATALGRAIEIDLGTRSAFKE